MNNETSIISINPGLLAALSSGAISIDVFAKEIVVLECLVAGTSFRKLENIEQELTQKVKLTTKREGDNQFDKFAIALMFNETKVGYIPKEKNEVIARLMDTGKQFYATIQAKEYEGNWLKLEIQVVMKD
jgi:hypothetical protein